ncbi:hypothetical protein EIK77_007380 [Talaromyces pinophilus]|nr:hypothetical protein EIK77_007380 [Talaromyces pinophilus]
MHPVYTQGKIRAVPQISEDLHAENLRSAAHATSNETHHEEARPAEPKAEDRQVGELKPEAVAEGYKPQRTRSRPLGPREPAVVTLGQAARRRGAAAQTHGEQVGDANPKTIAAESKPQRARSRPLGPRPPASELLGRRPIRRQGQEEDRFQRPVRRPSGPREPAPTLTRPPGSRQSYGAVEEILNMYHYSDDFYERYIPSNIATNNSSIGSRGRESEAPPVSRFDWTPSDSDDGRARHFFKEKKRILKKRLRDLKEKVKDQTGKAVRSIKSVGAVFKGIRRRRS